jgi:hypothetical protein
LRCTYTGKLEQALVDHIGQIAWKWPSFFHREPPDTCQLLGCCGSFLNGLTFQVIGLFDVLSVEMPKLLAFCPRCHYLDANPKQTGNELETLCATRTVVSNDFGINLYRALEIKVVLTLFTRDCLQNRYLMNSSIETCRNKIFPGQCCRNNTERKASHSIQSILYRFCRSSSDFMLAWVYQALSFWLA